MLNYCFYFIFAAALSAFMPQSGHAAIYKMQDLRVLEQQKNYLEFLDHAHDILPRNRNEQWREMLSAMAVGHVENLKSSLSFKIENLEYVEKLVAWPSLREDEFFVTKRNEYVVEFLSRCPESKAPGTCYQKVFDSWRKSPLKERFPDFPVKLAKHLNGVLPTKQLISLIAPAVKTPLGEFFCKKDHIQNLLALRASGFFQQERSREEILSFLSKNHHASCLSGWLPSLKSLLKDQNKKIREMAFWVLESKGMIGQEEKDTFLTLFILQGPVVGETFNMAWNELNSMGQNFERRQSVLEKLQEFDPLPGQVFASKDRERRHVLFRELNQNIPEYISFYGKTCLDFYEGKQDFPNGNPTTECKDFFRTYSKLAGPDDPMISRLESIRPVPFKL